MKNQYYDEMATKIQARWRGYYTRKYKHNFRARRNYLEVRIKNILNNIQGASITTTF